MQQHNDFVKQNAEAISLIAEENDKEGTLHGILPMPCEAYLFLFEHAAIEYRYSRLFKSWTKLGRQEIIPI